ncbi:MAG: ABC transporter substrate-binding protein [Vampirovibrionales bacterium]|nr:ABC transporter substrate-binding protein [Vampirovibrionales bacterium]
MSIVKMRAIPKLMAFSLAGLVVLNLCACAPPKASDDASLPGADGKPITKVQEHSKAPFETVEVDGVEMIQARGEVGKFGGTFYEISLGDGPKTFNGWESTDATSSELAAKMHIGLVDTDAYTGEVYPLLAREVKLLDDKRTYIATLRKGLVWSDGKPLTSADVVFTWNEIIAKGYGNTSQRDVNTINGKFPTIEAIDDLTVKFVTAEPFSPFLRNLSQPILPAHVFRSVIAKGGKKAFSNKWGVSEAQNHPEQFVSNGMWLLEKYNPVEKRVVFKKNPHYFFVDRKNQRLPYLDRYMISYVGDQNNLQLQFQQGNTDIYSIAGDKLALTRSLNSPDFRIYNLGPATGTTFVTFNLNTRKNQNQKPYVNPVHSAWFTKQGFRQAVDYAVNRDDIVRNIIKGVGEPLFTAECLSSIFLNKKIAKGHPQDIEKAKTLLKDAGFHWNADKQLIDEKGNLVEFTLLTNSGNTTREAIGVQIKDDLARLGMKVNLKPIDFNVLVSRIDNSDWDAIVLGLTGGTLEPNAGANVWKSDGRLHMFNQREIPDNGQVDLSDRYAWEKEIDTLFAQGVVTFDFNKRKEIYDRYQQIAYEQVPFIYLVSPLQMVAIKTRIQNWDPTPLGTLHNLEELWVK